MLYVLCTLRGRIALQWAVFSREGSPVYLFYYLILFYFLFFAAPIPWQMNLRFLETPTGWKFFGNLMDSKELGGEVRRGRYLDVYRTVCSSTVFARLGLALQGSNVLEPTVMLLCFG